MYLLNPPLALYLSKHPHDRPRSMWLGILLLTGGLCGAAFASQAWALILCQGVLYALGGSKPSVCHVVRLVIMLMGRCIQSVCTVQSQRICTFCLVVSQSLRS